MIVTENKENNMLNIFDKIIDLIVPKDKDSSELLPYKKIINEEVLLTNDNEYQAFFRVKTTDLTSISDDGFLRMVNKLTYLNRVYLEPYKIYSLTYPTDTVMQGLYWQHRVQEAKREIFNNQDIHKEKYLKWNLKLASDNFERVDLVKTLPELMFVIAVYGKTQKELKNNCEIIKQAGGKELGLQKIKGNDLEHIISKLMNPNSSI